MKTMRWGRMWGLLLAAGWLCGPAAPGARGEEPGSSSAATSLPSEYRPRLLEGHVPPWQLLWDDRPLYGLRLRAKHEGPGRHGTGVRSAYGGVAPLAVVPRHGDGQMGPYIGEAHRLERLIEAGQASADDYFLHGLIHYETRLFSIALRDFDMAVRMSAQPADRFYAMRGLTHYRLGDFRGAADDLGEAARLSPDARNLNNCGMLAALAGQKDAALAKFRATLEVQQSVVKLEPIHVNLALTLSVFGNHEEAIAELKKASFDDPEWRAVCLETAGLIYFRAGKPAEALSSYDRLIAMKQAEDAEYPLPTAMYFNGLIGHGMACHESGKHDAAIEDYSKAILLDPKATAAFVDRAVAYLDQGRLDLAQTDLEAALKLNPEEAFALGNRAVLRLRQGQAEEAQADFDHCLKLRADLRPVLQALMDNEKKQKAAPQPPVEHLRPSPFSTTVTPAPAPF